jgi:hypothetical protein
LQLNQATGFFDLFTTGFAFGFFAFGVGQADTGL